MSNAPIKSYIRLSQGPVKTIAYSLDSVVTRKAIREYVLLLRKKIDDRLDLRFEDLENLKMNTGNLLPRGFFYGSFLHYSAPGALVSTELLIEAIDVFAKLAIPVE
jgi:hypothetical protein